MAYELIETIEVGAGGASSIEFTSIPQDGTDLVVRMSLRHTDSTHGRVFVQFNTDTTANYEYIRLFGNGSVSGSKETSQTNILIGWANGTSSGANTFGNQQLYISNYTSATDKSVTTESVNEDDGSSPYQALVIGKYTTTSAISSLKLFASGSATMEQYSTASLYKVSNADASGATPEIPTPKATGGTITLAGGYWVHQFTSSGTFTATDNISSLEYVVVAGGGAGGGWSLANFEEGAGGGGAGGYRSSISGESSGGGASAESAITGISSSDTFTVTIGAGGAGVDGGVGNNGSSSSFDNISTTGGGRGGGATNNTGVAGGSGGGGGPSQNAGSGTANEGFAGGNGGGGTHTKSGGGGGSAEIGTNAGSNTSNSGVGGDGVASIVSGGSSTRAGGGGAGQAYSNNNTRISGGAGGGGRGGISSGNQIGASQDGQNGGGASGGGGGGAAPGATQSGAQAIGGNGGSGIVIVRYDA